MCITLTTTLTITNLLSKQAYTLTTFQKQVYKNKADVNVNLKKERLRKCYFLKRFFYHLL